MTSQSGSRVRWSAIAGTAVAVGLTAAHWGGIPIAESEGSESVDDVPTATAASAHDPPDERSTPAPVWARAGVSTARAGVSTAPRSFQEFNAPYDGLYHFVRIEWDQRRSRRGFGWGRGGGLLWAHDYPRADFNFLALLQEMTYVRSSDRASNVIRLDDPDLFRYPVAYIVEVGGWNPTDEEVRALGDYLMKGGFLIVDDFEGGRALANLGFHLGRAVPDATIQRVPESHEVFDSFFRIVPDDVIPPYGRLPPEWLGVYEDNDPAKRLMVMINANNDIAEYWEYSDRGYYPVDLSNEAYKLGVNYVVYGLTH